MVRIRPFATPLLVLSLITPSLGRAHVAELEATLAPGDETPPLTIPGAGGSGEFTIETDGTVSARVMFQGLTGPPNAAHIHEGPPGVAGPVRVPFDVAGALNTITGDGTARLTAAQQQTLFAGGMYFNIHTDTNGNGEIRGQIRLKPGVCSCDVTSPGDFKSCVRNAIRQIDKAEKKEAKASLKLLRRFLAKSACGKTKAPKKAVACCLPFAPSQNIVTDRICATIKAKQCENLGGTSAGTGIPCAPFPAACGSPSGAFVDGPAD